MSEGLIAVCLKAPQQCILLALAVYYCLAVTATCEVDVFFFIDNAVSQRHTIRCMQQRSALLLRY
jgi:hypothetical protein